MLISCRSRVSFLRKNIIYRLCPIRHSSTSPTSRDTKQEVECLKKSTRLSERKITGLGPKTTKTTIQVQNAKNETSTLIQYTEDDLLVSIIYLFKFNLFLIQRHLSKKTIRTKNLNRRQFKKFQLLFL